MTQRFTLGAPRAFHVTADGSRVLFLRALSAFDARHGLYLLDVASGTQSCLVDPRDLVVGEQRLTAEERALRERTRTQAGGVVGYASDDAGARATFTLYGQLYIVDIEAGDVRALPPSGVLDPRLDPTGKHIAYCQHGELRVIRADGTDDRALASSASEHVTWGMAEFIAAEEMDRTRGFWWGPDGEELIAARVDTSGVARWYIADPANPQSPPHSVAYPAAGSTNADVRLSIVDITGRHTDIRWDLAAFPYLVEVHWSAGGPPLVTVQSRDQKTINILAVDVTSGDTTLLHQESDEHWVDIIPGAPAWTSAGRLVRIGIRGDRHRIFVDDVDVTGEELEVRAILAIVDNEIVCTASVDDPTQIHVYRVGAGRPVRLSETDGVHSASRGGDTIVIASGGLDHSGSKVVVRQRERCVGRIESFAAEPPVSLNMELLTIGDRALRGALLLPAGYARGSGTLPVLLDPYGGPHAQRVLTSRNAFAASQWFADQGFAVLIVDGRGSPGRGAKWERAIAGEFAEVTLADQVDALHAVAARCDDLDLTRVGIRGWSYGGYLSALAVLRRPDVFHAAIAGAPVTDWRLYDTHYTERYLGHPAENPLTYQRNSLIDDAPALRRPLLLIHGVADDNVFAAHSLRLSSALLASGRAHDVLPLTQVTHMSPTDEDTAENFLRFQVDWLKRALKIDSEMY
ncbi:MAG: S9 family peptidase [Sciscionella sp.]|nr:S9 family peptidase [Sciscionella sp.]